MTTSSDQLPVVRLGTAAPRGPRRQMILFYIDETPYSIDETPSPSAALQLVEDIDQHGRAQAELIALRRVVGDDAFTALSTHNDLQSGQLEAIAATATAHLLSVLDTPGPSARDDAHTPRAAAAVRRARLVLDDVLPQRLAEAISRHEAQRRLAAEGIDEATARCALREAVADGCVARRTADSGAHLLWRVVR